MLMILIAVSASVTCVQEQNHRSSCTTIIPGHHHKTLKKQKCKLDFLLKFTQLFTSPLKHSRVFDVYVWG